MRNTEKDKIMETLTIFTPAYNRADLLVRGYEALNRQTCKDFVWMIIDDGSTDNTEEVVKAWIERTTDYRIQYIKKENGGLHTGYNTAIEYAETELMVCVDSDDYMPDSAVEIILDFWREHGSDKYAGIVGLDYSLEGEIIGDPLPNQKTINLIDLLVGKYPIFNGDRTNVIRTELYKKYAPMKVFPGEKNFNPHYMHLKISMEYDFLVLNKNLKYVEYQTGGMSNSMLRQYKSSPNSFAEIRKLYLSFPNTSLKFKVRHAIHLASSCILSGQSLSVVREATNMWIAAVTIPFGWLLSLYVRKKG